MALADGEVVGCIAYHKLSKTRCEMKHLYVKPEYRHTGMGESVAIEIILKAMQAGYEAMAFDTIEPLQRAIRLYKRLGFKEIETYYHNPMQDTIDMCLYL